MGFPKNFPRIMDCDLLAWVLFKLRLLDTCIDISLFSTGMWKHLFGNKYKSGSAKPDILEWGVLKEWYDCTVSFVQLNLKPPFKDFKLFYKLAIFVIFILRKRQKSSIYWSSSLNSIYTSASLVHFFCCCFSLVLVLSIILVAVTPLLVTIYLCAFWLKWLWATLFVMCNF